MAAFGGNARCSVTEPEPQTVLPPPALHPSAAQGQRANPADSPRCCSRKQLWCCDSARCFCSVPSWLTQAVAPSPALSRVRSTQRNPNKGTSSSSQSAERNEAQSARAVHCIAADCDVSSGFIRHRSLQAGDEEQVRVTKTLLQGRWPNVLSQVASLLSAAG